LIFGEKLTMSDNTMFGISIDAVTREDALGIVGDWLIDDRPGYCRYVVTPNVDHVIKLRKNPDFQRAYDEADLVMVDGWPIKSVSSLFGTLVPETIPGSDFVPWLLTDSMVRQPTLRVFLLGAAEGVAETAARRIEARWPGITVVGCLSPSMQFESDPAQCEAVFAAIDRAAPDLLIMGLGAPKQEIFASRHRHRLHAKVALCVGATIDFMAGHRRRAPLLVRRMRMEWLYRSLSEPRRLGGRYLTGMFQFPMIVTQELVNRYWR
jgi:N-acetylglucosaminyldiphosphoundecaprenol N-acetyl-beta-D-mannosaminyltransferase